MNQINKEPEYAKKPMELTQEEWVEYFNKKGVKMISAPDIYKAIKEKQKKVIESLKKDFEDSWEVTSTRIEYNGNNLKAKIVHDVDSKVVKPKTYKVEVPNCSGDFEQDSITEKYLQALFDTKDSIDKIISTLESVCSGKKVKLWTPSQSSRKDTPLRVVGLYFGYGRFSVDGGGWFDGDGGLSRGVIISSAKQEAKKC